MATPKKKFVLRIPLRKLREAKENKRNANNATQNLDSNSTTQDLNDTDSASTTVSTTISCPQSPQTSDTTLRNDDDSEDMHDIHSLPQDCPLPQISPAIPPLDKQLSNNDIYTDDDDDQDNGQNGRKLKLNSAFSMDTDDSLHSEESDSDEDAEDQNDIEMKTHNDERERLRKQKENNLRIVDREYENLMKEMRSTNATQTLHKTKVLPNMPSNEILKIERQKEIESVVHDDSDWIQNEKHAICMRHITIRDDSKGLLSSFIGVCMDNNQFKFIKVNLETYFKLKQHQITDNLFMNMDRLQLNQLFNCELSTEIRSKMVDSIHKFEEYLMSKHFSVFKKEKSVSFNMEEYEKDCGSVKNKLESCPILYILLIKKEISFNTLLSSDMISICLICINAVIRKKVQRKLESLVKKENAISVEDLLFKHWNKNRMEFIKEFVVNNSSNDDDIQIVDVFDKNKILHDKYPLFCQDYLKFLMSFPNYRNAIIDNSLSMNKIFELSAKELLDPPFLENKKKILNTQNLKKRKATSISTYYPSLTKRRKLSADINHNNNSKRQVIWDGLLINDTVKCHVKMKQIGGKSIWTLPFKHHRNTIDLSCKQSLSITGRINILSIIKFIKQLRKHKTRRIIFAEMESNEYVNHKSYNTLCAALRCSNRAGVIDREKQCGILIYIISSSCLAPTHSMSHQLNKYFDGHKARTPKTKMFCIIILSLDVYNQVKRKMSKAISSSNHEPKPTQPRPQMAASQPPKPTQPRPPQPPKPPNITHKKDVNNVDDVWDKINNEIEDDLGELPPPLPAHLLAERERYKQQTTAPAPPPLPMPHNQTVYAPPIQPPPQPIMYQTVQPPPPQLYAQGYPPHHVQSHYG